jgi:hypothetical protein
VLQVERLQVGVHDLHFAIEAFDQAPSLHDADARGGLLRASAS